ncbi:MAG: hypothetical protein QG564_1437 [Campylobacterota bacterium]|nr:hypothetical protein [Campylobacterota bacterium]
MTKKISLFFILFMMVFLFSGCVERELSLSEDGSRSSGYPKWGGQSSAEEENVDISDLEDETETITEDEMIITDEMSQQKVQRIPFPVSEYARLLKTGKGTVKGTIYLADGYNRRVLGSSTRLYLNPLTSYSRQWYKESYLGGYPMDESDSRLFNYLRFTASDAQGNFAFYGVPSGRYYLVGTVQCGHECGYDAPKNIRIATEITVMGNQIVQKDLTRVVE